MLFPGDSQVLTIVGVIRGSSPLNYVNPAPVSDVAGGGSPGPRVRRHSYPRIGFIPMSSV